MLAKYAGKGVDEGLSNLHDLPVEGLGLCCSLMPLMEEAGGQAATLAFGQGTRTARVDF